MAHYGQIPSTIDDTIAYGSFMDLSLVRFPHQAPRKMEAGGELDNFVRGGAYNPLSSECLPTTFGVVDLQVLRDNIEVVKGAAEGADVISVVKSDAMGLSAEIVGKESLVGGAAALAVGSAQEAASLVQSGVPGNRLICLYPPPHWDIPSLVRNNVDITVQDLAGLRGVADVANKLGTVVRVHVKCNTGFNRYGAQPGDVLGLVQAFEDLESVRFGGVYSHFATAGTDLAFMERQFADYLTVLKTLSDHGHAVPYVHMANSAAVACFPAASNPAVYRQLFDSSSVMVRVGGALLGFTEEQGPPGIRSILTSVVSHVSGFYRKDHLAEGTGVGYDRLGVLDGTRNLITLPLGWGEGGIDYELSGAEVLIGSERARIVGLTAASAVSATTLGEYRPGDRVMLLGAQEGESITLQDFTRYTSNAIVEQLTVQLGHTVPLVFRHALGQY